MAGIGPEIGSLSYVSSADSFASRETRGTSVVPAVSRKASLFKKSLRRHPATDSPRARGSETLQCRHCPACQLSDKTVGQGSSSFLHILT